MEVERCLRLYRRSWVYSSNGLRQSGWMMRNINKGRTKSSNTKEAKWDEEKEKKKDEKTKKKAMEVVAEEEEEEEAGLGNSRDGSSSQGSRTRGSTTPLGANYNVAWKRRSIDYETRGRREWTTIESSVAISRSVNFAFLFALMIFTCECLCEGIRKKWKTQSHFLRLRNLQIYRKHKYPRSNSSIVLSEHFFAIFTAD